MFLGYSQMRFAEFTLRIDVYTLMPRWPRLYESDIQIRATSLQKGNIGYLFKIVLDIYEGEILVY